jgi:hypothetical protein
VGSDAPKAYAEVIFCISLLSLSPKAYAEERHFWPIRFSKKIAKKQFIEHFF